MKNIFNDNNNIRFIGSIQNFKWNRNISNIWSGIECSVEYGVPRAFLGHLLFLIYINDIVNCSDLGTFILFADDKINLFMKRARQMDKYMIKNHFHMNMSKSVHVMHFKPSLNFSNRLTCARVREHGSERVIKIGNIALFKSHLSYCI